jgi:2'-5' RNA ligase
MIGFMRAFIALPLPDTIRDALEDVQARLKVGRRADPETFHITLAYLGDNVPDRDLEAAHEALESLAAGPLTLRIDGLETYGSGTPRVLVAAVQPDPGLMALQRKIRSLLHGAGLMLPRERFRPHVTLARFPPGPGAGVEVELAAFMGRNATFGSGNFTVREVILYRSTLTGDGAIHRAIAEYPLL